jgi:hypothetical protein
LNISPTEMEPRRKEEEFTLRDNREEEASENTSSPSQLLRYGESRKQVQAKVSPLDQTLETEVEPGGRVSGTKSFSS